LTSYVPPSAPTPVVLHAPPVTAIDWTEISLFVLLGGMAIRMIWLATGLWRLSRLRKHSTPLPVASSWSVEADIRISDAISSPVTFGYIQPTVLLPANFHELEASAQEAILCHEVLHVRRKDWLWTVAEELVRCVFWFHPAIWWLLGEIGLAREQVVDREVVEVTRSRDEYVDALLAIAGATPRLDLAPAPLFLRKRHLKQRVVSIMKEVRMSKTRSISSLAAGLGILAAACWMVTATFPLAAAPQMVTDGPGVTVDAGGSVLHRGSVSYPPSALMKRVQGVVTVEATVDSTGNVVDTRVLSGSMELRRAAQQSVLTWHFAMDTSSTTRQVKVNFDLTGVPEASFTQLTGSVLAPPAMDAASRAEAEAKVSALRSQITEQAKQMQDPAKTQDPAKRQETMAKLSEMQATMNALQTRMGPPTMEGRRLNQINVQGLNDTMRNDLMSRLGVHVGDTMNSAALERVRKAAMEFDEHMQVGTMYGKDNEVSLMLMMPGARAGGAVGSGPSVGFASTEPKPNVPGRITIGGNVQSAKLIRQPKPVYPPLAKQARISGVVHLAAIISKEGQVIDLKVISGHPLLIPSALEAVQQWVYQQTLLNGEPVEVSTQIDVNYTLSDEIPQ